MGWIHRAGLSWRDSKVARIKVPDAFEEAAPLGVHTPRDFGVGIIKVVGVPTAPGDLLDAVAAGFDQVPEGAKVVAAAGEAAGHGNYG